MLNHFDVVYSLFFATLMMNDGRMIFRRLTLLTVEFVVCINRIDVNFSRGIMSIWMSLNLLMDPYFW